MEIKPLHTSIQKQENTDIGIAVLENYNEYPRGQSNLYVLNNKGEIIWFGKLPTERDTFVDFKYDLARNVIIAWTWEGIMYDIDLVSGKTIKEKFVK